MKVKRGRDGWVLCRGFLHPPRFQKEPTKADLEAKCVYYFQLRCKQKADWILSTLLGYVPASSQRTVSQSWGGIKKIFLTKSGSQLHGLMWIGTWHSGREKGCYCSWQMSKASGGKHTWHGHIMPMSSSSWQEKGQARGRDRMAPTGKHYLGIIFLAGGRMMSAIFGCLGRIRRSGYQLCDLGEKSLPLLGFCYRRLNQRLQTQGPPSPIWPVDSCWLTSPVF